VEFLSNFEEKKQPVVRSRHYPIMTVNPIRQKLPFGGWGLLLLYSLLSGCAKKVTQQYNSKITAPKREFRAVWVATVDNIDFPSKKGLTSDVQQEEYRKILDFHKKTGLNAVLVQVRAASDAFYARSVEPWSEWLSGEQGKSPEPFYDPMRFMIQETHQRNMEFHAWLNLNRGTHRVSKSIAKDHITNTKPDWFVSYDGYKFYDLGLPEVRKYIVDLVGNIVKYYDVDGIHFDDYFYPYPSPKEKFKDDASFKKYGAGFKKIDDWRRNNIDILIKEIGEAIKKENPKVKYGVSPFAVWRNAANDPNGSQTTGGNTSYDHMYADTRKWVQKGWVDYIAPQIYFSFEFDKIPYKNMADWWIKNSFNKHLYIGHGAYRAATGSKDKGWELANQIPRQIRYNRSLNLISGSIFFSSKSLTRNNLNITDSLTNLYKYPALLPTMTWKDNVPPNAPMNVKVRPLSDLGVVVTWELPEKPARDGDEINAFVVYRFDENEVINIENPARIVQIVRNEGILSLADKSAVPNRIYKYVVTALDRLHNESVISNEAVLK
jgi:uncharacterized lipoprotein YddW (UPF0748 family)